MPIGITATFLLGTYTGHAADGRADSLPDTARLHAALLNAAGQGITAVEGERGLEPSARARAALHWLERNPPTGMRLPERSQLTSRAVIAYRKEGTVPKEGGQWVDKVTSRPFSDGYAVADAVGWCWDEGIPDDIRVSLGELCADVGCLGESTSPVRLEIGEVEPTDIADPAAGFFDPGGVDVRTPVAGRTAALEAAHAQFVAKSPSVARDKHGTGDKASPQPTIGVGVDRVRYRPKHKPTAEVPWSRVILLPTDRVVRAADRVSWATTLRKALIKTIGRDVPPLVTGHYDSGVARPANGLGIQYLPARMVAHHGVDAAAFALLIPADAPADDLEPLVSAVHRLPHIHRRRDEAAELGSPRIADGADFWAPPAPGSLRLWETSTVAVPETLPQRRGCAGGDDSGRWSLADAVLVSVGLVWRDRLNVPRRAGATSRWFEDIAAETARQGVKVIRTRAAQTSEVGQWVHKAPKGMLVQPYQAVLSLGRLATAQSVTTIGQSRHLGGGLLVPRDVALDAALGGLR
jgi:CRISPR-associated protein Csb2